MNAWIIVLIAGLGSYLLRISMISAGRIRLPSRFDEPLGLAAPAAFAALAVSSLAGTVLDAGASHGVAVLAAVVVAALATARTGRGYVAALTGMPVFWLVTALTP